MDFLPDINSGSLLQTQIVVASFDIDNKFFLYQVGDRFLNLFNFVSPGVNPYNLLFCWCEALKLLVILPGSGSG